jgi:hypothetical protein
MHFRQFESVVSLAVQGAREVHSVLDRDVKAYTANLAAKRQVVRSEEVTLQ